MPKPSGKSNLVHQLLLAGLVANKPRSIANNVSEFNANRAARRWSK